MEHFAVIFDLNGTIADTERAYYLAYQEALLPYGIEFQIQEFTEHWSVKGKNLADFFTLRGRAELVTAVPAILKSKDEIFQRTLGERITMMPGASAVLSLLNETGVPLALDSSTSSENIGKILTAVKLVHYFPVICAGDTPLDENRYGDRKKKAARLRYLADRLACAPARCIVVGDAEKDIAGAKEAGMLAVAVPNIYTRDNDFGRADGVFDSLRTIGIEKLRRLFETAEA